MNFKYPKNEKLKSKITIGLLFTEGKSVSKYPLRLVYHSGELSDGQKIKMGVSVSKKNFKIEFKSLNYEQSYLFGG